MMPDFDKYQFATGGYVNGGGKVIVGGEPYGYIISPNTTVEFVGLGWGQKTVEMSKTDEDGNTQTVEMIVHADGTVHVDAAAMMVLMEQLGFK